MKVHPVIRASIFFILIIFLGSKVAENKTGLDVAAAKLATHGIAVPDLLKPVKVWTQGEATLSAILENPEAKVVYLEASLNYDIAFPTALGFMLMTLLFAVPVTAWPARLQKESRFIVLALGAFVIGFDFSENGSILEYLNSGGSAILLVCFQITSTLKWTFLAITNLTILVLYLRWGRERMMKNWPIAAM